MAAARIAFVLALALLMPSSVPASSASSTDLLLVLTVPVLPQGVFIDNMLTGAFPLFCTPDIGSGGCIGPTFTNNLLPGLNFGGPYQFFWSDQQAYSSAPSPNFASHSAIEQTIITFGTLGSEPLTISIPWHMSYLLATDGVSSTASITTDIREDLVGGGVLLPFMPIWAGDTISDGNPMSKAGEASGSNIPVLIFPGNETSLSVFDPETAQAAVPEPNSIVLSGSGLLGLVLASACARKKAAARHC
jgi:hypothetical protein